MTESRLRCVWPGGATIRCGLKYNNVYTSRIYIQGLIILNGIKHNAYNNLCMEKNIIG